jgi:hypothetical protein
MDRDLPRRIASGLYPVERSGELTFAWTSRRADIKLPGLNRRHAWTCAVRFRGARSDGSTQPTVDVAVDGITAASVSATNDFQDVQISLPIRDSGEGVVVSLTSSQTIVPGPSDSRELGVQIDRAECRPQAVSSASRRGRPFVMPHWQRRSSGAAFALVSASFTVAATARGLSRSSIPSAFSRPCALHRVFGRHVVVRLLDCADDGRPSEAYERWREARFENAATVAVMFSGAALYVKLLGLLHPSKLPVDAVFHAHRFEWVLDGRYFFTQPMPGGVTFPYAIGLYLFAAPWSLIAHDHVTLLRVVVSAAEVVAGALLYPLIGTAWRDRRAAVLAVVLINLVPLTYGLVGNANLTNAFGEAVALATLVSASMLPGRRYLAAAGLFLLAALAFLSHVSTFALLGVTLVSLCILYRCRGESLLRPLAWTILGVTILAALFASPSTTGTSLTCWTAQGALRHGRHTGSIAARRTVDAVCDRNGLLGTRVGDALGFAA